MIRKNTREMTICGTILPDEWDKNGRVTSIGIETEDEQDYIIFLDEIGEKFFKLLDREVEAKGTVENKYGDLVFTVKEYRLLEKKEEKVAIRQTVSDY